MNKVFQNHCPAKDEGYDVKMEGRASKQKVKWTVETVSAFYDPDGVTEGNGVSN